MITKAKAYAFKQDAAGALTEEPAALFLNKCIQEHLKEKSRYEKLLSYYRGQDINKAAADNISVNHAKNIVDTIGGYVFGEPVSYRSGNVEDIVEWFTVIDEDSHNTQLGTTMGIVGRAYELVYMDDVFNTGEVLPCLAELSPLNTFVVYDTDIKQTPIAGITYSANHDLDDKVVDYTVIVYTENYIFTYKIKSLDNQNFKLVKEPEQHQFNGVPLHRLVNNKEEQGDFEQVLSLIEAYDSVCTNRVVDKEKFVNSILCVRNMVMGDDEEEINEVIKLINQNRLLELSEDGEAYYLSKSLNEADIEILKKALLDDICTITKCPNLTDQNFVGNSSGIAMRYKILGLEQVGKMKERQFKKFLRNRLRILSPVLSLKGMGITLAEVSIEMKRTLPKDDLERLQILQGTEGILSLRTRLQRYDEELDVEEELRRIEEEQDKKNKSMAMAFGSYQFPEPQQNNAQEVQEVQEV